MSLARAVFQARRLAERYGPAGRVAGRYVLAGYNVTMNFKTPHGEVSFIAKRGQELYAVDVVVESGPVRVERLEAIRRKAESIRAKPVLALYGAGPEATKELVEKARELGVKIKRFRF